MAAARHLGVMHHERGALLRPETFERVQERD